MNKFSKLFFVLISVSLVINLKGVRPLNMKDIKKESLYKAIAKQYESSEKIKKNKANLLENLKKLIRNKYYNSATKKLEYLSSSYLETIASFLESEPLKLMDESLFFKLAYLIEKPGRFDFIKKTIKSDIIGGTPEEDIMEAQKKAITRAQEIVDFLKEWSKTQREYIKEAETKAQAEKQKITQSVQDLADSLNSIKPT